MSDAPLMPKATAVWLVENTSLTFDQIAEFCKLHPLEVKGIADGEVATGIKGHDPIASGQLTREEIAAGEKDSGHRLALAVAKVRLPEFKKQRGARYTPLSRRHDRPNAVLWLLRNHGELKDAQIMRLVGTTKHTLQAIRERTHWNSANLQPMDLVTLGLCSQIDLDFEVNRAAKERPKVEEDRAQTLVSAEITTARPTTAPASQLEVFGVPTPKPKPVEERVDVNSVFGKLKEKTPPEGECAGRAVLLKLLLLNCGLAEWPHRYGRFILLRVSRRIHCSADAIWEGVACGLVTGVCAPSGHSAGHSLRFLARTP